MRVRRYEFGLQWCRPATARRNGHAHGGERLRPGAADHAHLALIVSRVPLCSEGQAQGFAHIAQSLVAPQMAAA